MIRKPSAFCSYIFSSYTSAGGSYTSAGGHPNDLRMLKLNSDDFHWSEVVISRMMPAVGSAGSEGEKAEVGQLLFPTRHLDATPPVRFSLSLHRVLGQSS